MRREILAARRDKGVETVEIQGQYNTYNTFSHSPCLYHQSGLTLEFSEVRERRSGLAMDMRLLVGAEASPELHVSPGPGAAAHICLALSLFRTIAPLP